MFVGRSSRALAALIILLWMVVYLSAVWFIGADFIPENWVWQVIYFPIAGLAWVPVAILIMHKVIK